LSDRPTFRPRAEHLAWCKQRALEYVDAGMLQMAITSMLSDLSKHPDTAPLTAALGPLALWEAVNGGKTSTRRFIEGFQ
jgi:hypothetical protein